ncbi:unnamed protein product, partial [Closterium sp. NIES-53]
AAAAAVSVGVSGENRGGVVAAAPAVSVGASRESRGVAAAAAVSVGASEESRGGVSAVAVSLGASRESRGGVAAAAAAGVSVGASGEGRGGVIAAVAAAAVSVGASRESRGGVTAAAAARAPAPAAGAAATAAALSVGASGESRAGVTSAAGAGTVIADARGGGAAATATVRPARPSTCTLGFPIGLVTVQTVRFTLFSALVFHLLQSFHTLLSPLVTTVAGFASSHRLDYAAHLVSSPTHSPSSGGAPVFPLEVLEHWQFELGFLAAAVPHLCAMLLAPKGDPDALDIPIPRTHAEAVSRPWASYWIATEQAEMASYRSTGTYVDAVPPPEENVVSGMWLYKVKRPPGAPPRDYELHSLDFSTTFLQGSLHEQIWLHRLPGFTGNFPPGTQWQLRRPVYGLRQAPRGWHDMLRTTLGALGFFPSSADPLLFVRRSSTLFFFLVYVDDLVFATPDRRALASVKDELQRRHTCTDLGELQRYLGLSSRGFASHSPRVAKYVASTSGMRLVLGGKQLVTLTGYSNSSWADDAESLRCEAEVYTAAMAAQELHWLSFLLTYLGERPRSPPVLFADNRSDVLLCEPREVGKAKHIKLRYFLLQEFQQRGQARVVRVVSEAGTSDIFTKALPPCAHHRFCTQLCLVSTGPYLLA